MPVFLMFLRGGMLVFSIAKWQLTGIFTFGESELKKEGILEIQFLVVLLKACT